MLFYIVLIEDTLLEWVIERIRDFNTYAAFIRQNKNVAWRFEHSEKGKTDQYFIENLDVINLTYLETYYWWSVDF